ncbi:MAG: hypothetical protein ACW98K_17445 [Candidatus Kariarchaeaceae archaeon]|jgi:hypothetical protein
MLYIGFDPAFIDTLVRVEDEHGVLNEHLPQPGFHHRSSKILKNAGGNGTNVAYVLSKLNIPCTLVVPTNQQFISLLKERGIEKFVSLNTEVNETVGISWAPGEIQFNAVTGSLGKAHWISPIHDLWMGSDLHTYLNWGLNQTSNEWVACQWLASCGWSYEEISQEKDYLQQALESSSIQYPIFLEPGSIVKHLHFEYLQSLLKQIGSTYFDSWLPLLSCNEEEKSEFKGVSFPTIIIHTEDRVTLARNDQEIHLHVPTLRNEPATFVGAGDAFTAGLIARYLDKKQIDPEYATQIAQSFLMGEL